MVARLTLYVCAIAAAPSLKEPIELVPWSVNVVGRDPYGDGRNCTRVGLLGLTYKGPDLNLEHIELECPGASENFMVQKSLYLSNVWLGGGIKQTDNSAVNFAIDAFEIAAAKISIMQNPIHILVYSRESIWCVATRISLHFLDNVIF